MEGTRNRVRGRGFVKQCARILGLREELKPWRGRELDPQPYLAKQIGTGRRHTERPVGFLPTLPYRTAELDGACKISLRAGLIRAAAGAQRLVVVRCLSRGLRSR